MVTDPSHQSLVSEADNHSHDVPISDEFPNLRLARTMTDERTAQEMKTRRPPPSPSPYTPSSIVFYKPVVIKSNKPCTKPMEPKGH